MRRYATPYAVRWLMALGRSGVVFDPDAKAFVLNRAGRGSNDRSSAAEAWPNSFVACVLSILVFSQLTGCTVAGVRVAPTNVSWSGVPIGFTGNPKVVTLSNVGTSPISIGSIAIGGSNPGDFRILSQTCGSRLEASSKCTATVIFGPIATGNRSATLNFQHSGLNASQTVALSGTGTTPLSTSFSMQPISPTIVVNQALQFSATTNVSWTASCGTIANSGIYTSPPLPGLCTVTATSTANSQNAESTQVTIIQTPALGALAVYPDSAAVVAQSEQVFQAQVGGVPDGDPLTYTIDGVVGGNATTGTISNGGVYTAPSVAGAHFLAVTDQSLGITATATIDVFSAITADFGSRSTSRFAIPANLIGAERMESLRTDADLELIKAGGISYARFYALIPSVFATKTPDWTQIDYNVQRISAGGVRVMLQMYGTPSWLQPNPNRCGAGVESARVLPTDLNTWGAIAAQYVKHMDETFPGVVTDYEIWNEPDSASLCVPAGTSHLIEYMKLYAAAAPLMRAQVKADRSTARVGGPAIYGLDPQWVGAMLSDPTIAQNIDFLSYHHYTFGLGQLVAEWDIYHGGMSAYQATQDSDLSPMAMYLLASELVAQGKQPQGKNLPIYDSEFNLNWAYAKDCCRNDFTFAPVWNAMYVADVLNAVYAGAPHAMGHLVYFAASAQPYFCLAGEINVNMDCTYPTASPLQPYPQYFAYQLLGAQAYLGLQNGGFMANSIYPPTLGNGLVVTAFYTKDLDAIVVINPSQYSYRSVTVNAVNTGFASPLATLYEIKDGRSIQNSSLPLQSQGNGSYSATLPIGPYSVQAISLHN